MILNKRCLEFAFIKILVLVRVKRAASQNVLSNVNFNYCIKSQKEYNTMGATCATCRARIMLTLLEHHLRSPSFWWGFVFLSL